MQDDHQLPASEKVFIHIGLHKTGTTSIQALLGKVPHLIDYPKPEAKGPGHAAISDQVVFHEGDPSRIGLLVDLVRKAREARSVPRPFVFSSEGFSRYGLHPGNTEPLRLLAEAYPTELVITVKPPRDRVVPFIGQMIKRGIHMELEEPELIFSRLKTTYSGFIPDFFHIMLECAPWAHTHIIFTDQGRPGHLFESFARLLEVDLIPNLEEKDMILNSRLSFLESAILNEINRQLPGTEPQQRDAKILAAMNIYNLVQAHFPAAGRIPYPRYRTS
jgi:hypothetical protein